MTRHDPHAWRQWCAAIDKAPVTDQPVAPQPGHPAPDHRFFTVEDIRFLRAAVDRLLPLDKYPSASRAGVIAHIDGQLAGSYGQSACVCMHAPVQLETAQQNFQLGLTPASLYRESLDALASHDAGRSFATRSAAQQDSFLRQLEAGHWLLGRVPSAVFFETLLTHTVGGYFAAPGLETGCGKEASATALAPQPIRVQESATPLLPEACMPSVPSRVPDSRAASAA